MPGLPAEDRTGRNRPRHISSSVSTPLLSSERRPWAAHSIERFGASTFRSCAWLAGGMAVTRITAEAVYCYIGSMHITAYISESELWWTRALFGGGATAWEPNADKYSFIMAQFPPRLIDRRVAVSRACLCLGQQHPTRIRSNQDLIRTSPVLSHTVPRGHSAHDEVY